jgi:hypothetical protein
VSPVSLEEFFAALDGQHHDLTEDELVAEGGIERGGEISLPTFKRWAERAGLDLADITTLIHSRIGLPCSVVERRIDTEEETIHGGLHLVAAAAGIQFFLAGVLWEQQRQMPDLGDLG